MKRKSRAKKRWATWDEVPQSVREGVLFGLEYDAADRTCKQSFVHRDAFCICIGLADAKGAAAKLLRKQGQVE